MAGERTVKVTLLGDEKRAVSALKNTEGAAGGLEGKLSALGGVVSGVGGKIGAILGGAAVVGVGAVAALGGSAVAAGVQFNSMYQQAQIGFTTMLGDAGKADAFLKNLASFAASTPFEFPDLISAAQKLKAMGFEADQVIPVLTDIGDAVAAMGGNAEMVDRVTTAFGQMQAKGKASAEEMAQLTEAGIPGWKYLAEAIGVDVPTAMKMVENGAVSAETVITAVRKGIQRDFGGMMAAQSQSFQGLLSTLKDTYSQAAGQVMKPLFDALTRGAGQLVQMVSGPEFKAFVEVMAGGMATAVAAIESGLGRAAGFVRDFRAALAGDAGAGFAGTLAVSFQLIGDTIENRLVPAFNLIRSAFGGVKTDSAGAQSGLSLLERAVLGVASVFESVARGVQLLADVLVTAKQAFDGTWSDSDQLAGPIRLVGQAFTLVGDGVRQVQAWFARLPGPVLQVVGGFLALGPGIRVVAMLLPALVGGLGALVPVVGVLTSTLTILGTVIAAVGWPITLLVAGVAALALAWTTNFLGIRDVTMPILQAIGGFFTGTLLPAIQQVGAQIGAVLLPALSQMGAAVIGAFQAALPGLQAFWSGVQQLAAVVVPILQEVGAHIMGSLGPALEAVGNWAQTVIPQFAAAWVTVWGIIGPLIGGIAEFIGATLGAIAGFISAHSGEIVAILTATWDIISNIIGATFALITGIISAGLQLISGDWQGAWNTVLATGQSIWQSIQNVFVAAWEFIKNLFTLAFSDILDKVGAWGSEMFTNFTTLGGNLKQSVIDFTESIITTMVGWAANALTQATQFGENIKSAITSATGAALQTVKDWIGNVGGELAGIAGQVAGWVGDLSGALVQAGKDLIGGLIQGIRDMIGELAGVLGDITSMLPDWKGPAERDRAILRPTGRLVMEGFVDGLRDGARLVQAQLGGMTGALPATAGGGAYGSFTSGGNSYHFHAPVYGVDHFEEMVARANRMNGVRRRGG